MKKKMYIIMGVAVVIIMAICLFLLKFYKNDKIENKIDNTKYEYTLEKFSDKIDDNIDFYDEFKKAKWGYILNYRDDNNNSKYVFYDNNGKNITNEIYNFSNLSYSGYFNEKLSHLIIDVEENNFHNILIINLENKDKIIKLDGLQANGLLGNNYIIVSNNDGKYGVCDVNGNNVVPVEYEEIREIDYTNYKYIMAVKNGKTGIIDFNNNIIVSFEYDKVSYASQVLVINDNLFPLRKDGNLGLVDKNNNVVIPFDGKVNQIKYDEKSKYIYSYYDDRERIMNYNEALKGIQSINIYKSTGEYIKTLEFEDEIDSYAEPLTISFKDLDNIYIMGDSDKKGENYEYVINIFDDIVVKKDSNNTYGLYNFNGKKVIDDSYEVVTYKSTSERDIDCIVACHEYYNNGSNCGYISKTGEKLTDFKYNYDFHALYNDDEIVEMYNGKIIKLHLSDKYSKSFYFLDEDHIVSTDVDTMNADNRVIIDLNTNSISNSFVNVFKGLNNNIYIFEDMGKTQESDRYSDHPYSIYNSNFEMINYKNKDNAVLLHYLGEVKNQSYFYTNKGIYVLKSAKIKA